MYNLETLLIRKKRYTLPTFFLHVQFQKLCNKKIKMQKRQKFIFNFKIHTNKGKIFLLLYPLCPFLNPKIHAEKGEKN